MILEQLPSDFYNFQSLLTEQEQQTVAKVRRFFEDKIAPRANDAWASAEFQFDLVPGFAALDIVKLPDEGARSLLTGWIALEMSRVDPSHSTFYGVHSGLATGSIRTFGSNYLKKNVLPAMIRMEKIGAFALTEPEGGSDVSGGMRTVARRDGDGWILNGAKRWIGNGTFADYVVVWARDEADNKVKGFVVEKGSAGFSATKIERKMALRTVQNADIILTDCYVPLTHQLTSKGFRDTAELLRRTRAGVAWSSVGIMMGAYEHALAYTKTRKQFGKPIASYQLVQDLLVRMLGNITTCLGLVVRLAQAQDEGVYRDEHSALAKATCTYRMREVVGWARELLGGNGIVLDYNIGRFVADAEAIYSYEGTREMNSLVTARAITGLSAFV
ncbi:glutaryl-CoA dehydrogenase [Bradyrhizobiaceae bacterium SG-6C]|nr:glutaryl-CoA dehydrogenase [Bradyrhizobiaceae bacterium SG-6C]